MLANHSRLMRELLSSLFSDQSDIEIVDNVTAGEDIVDHAGKVKPDFVIIDSEDAAKVSAHVLREFPNLKVLAIPTNKHGSRLYWADGEIHWQKLDTSAEGILRALREGHEDSSSRTKLPKAS